MNKIYALLLFFLTMMVGLVFFSEELKRFDSPSYEDRLAAERATATSESIIRSENQTGSYIKIINLEQDAQAERCKNGSSDGCAKERSIADFKRATGQ